MTKQELLNALAQDFYYVAEPKLMDTVGELKVYQVPLFEQKGDALSQRFGNILVRNEGQPGEEAFWAVAQAKPAPATTFNDDVNAFIAAKIADGTILAAFLEFVDNRNEKASLWAYRLVTTQVHEIKVLLRRENGVIVHQMVDVIRKVGG